MDTRHGGVPRGEPAPGSGLPHRPLAAAIAALLATAGALVATEQPAAALITYVRPVSVSYTDARQPTMSFQGTDGTVPVGTSDVDGAKQTSRAYFTFDLSGYHGRRIINAVGISGESTVNDCDKPRELELWHTDTPAGFPTWETAPTVREKIADFNPLTSCPSGYLELSLTEAIRQAVADRQDRITIMARIAGDHEESKHYGRRIKDLGISLTHNRAPNVPGKLAVGIYPCADNLFINTTAPYLTAELTDPDVNQTGGGDWVTATFAWWPVDRPAERTEWTSYYSLDAPATFRYDVPYGLMVDGVTYAFAVRAADEYDVSAWSPECRFTVDTVAPPEPTVSSTDYPPGWEGPGYGGPGIPGRFTFSANGADDVKGYYYGDWGPAHYVAAESLGASVTITYTPTSPGTHSLYVQSVDRAGNLSAEMTQYEFVVASPAA
ncbi:hypothetical protein GA0070624_4527 [Micromonospora rhizosphaerae]|uniref:Uncharacterized protein n=1 Tax=Micromonospora rhizosphaerae TaxID=568872 RepID=A0A1C6SSL8_9ACTN|nr:hypothetical protein [Micromonospora rhizosphaerae]SCL32634.1 hypothetical protein GA0070624_4527 [Micromonospora rhizosphaerae]